jgi:hypothetical protein
VLREQMIELRYMMREVIAHMGEALMDAPEPVRVAAAREVVARRCDLFNCAADIRVFSLLVAELERVVVKLRDGGLDEQPSEVLYLAEGIEFAALVEIEQIAATAAGWSWTGEDLRRLGNEIAGGDELSWLTDEYAEIRSATGHLRNFYRRQ